MSTSSETLAAGRRREALIALEKLHPECWERLVPSLRQMADRMEAGSPPITGATFLSSHRATLREAASSIERLRAALLSAPEPREPVGLGQAIRDARTAAGISLREAAALLGTTAIRLGEVERGVRTGRVVGPSPGDAMAAMNDNPWIVRDGALTNGRTKLSLWEGEAEDADLAALREQLERGRAPTPAQVDAAATEGLREAFVAGAYWQRVRGEGSDDREAGFAFEVWAELAAARVREVSDG